MSIHLPQQAALADTQPRLAPKLALDGHDEISALKLAVPIVRRWPLVVWSMVMLGAAGLAASLLLPAHYTARTTFTVESGGNGLSMPKGLVGLAGQLGMVLGSNGSGAPPPDYFTALAASRTIGESLLADRKSVV